MLRANGWVYKFFVSILLVVLLSAAVGTPDGVVYAQSGGSIGKSNLGKAGAELVSGFRAPLFDVCASPANEIVAENCLTGNPSSEWEVTGAGDSSIQGFATDISVDQGQTVNFKIDTTSSDYRIDIYRLGYYGGLGARKVATVSTGSTTETDQPACQVFDGTTDDNLVDCGNWSVSASWAVPSNAVSGVYIARLVRQDVGGDLASHIVFIVRDDDGGSDLLFQTSDTTWQAYNQYGGYSLYAGPLGHAHKVSYNRPFTTRDTPIEDWLFNAEYPMIRWLERNGYDVSYFTDVDSDRHGSEILEHEVFLSVGHDEYWSAGQRANVEAARDGGVNLAFFSGNEIYWKTRWEDSYRTLVSYKEGDAQGSEHYNCQGNFDCDPNPDTWTGLWRQNQTGHDGGQPENSLSGQISWGDATTAMQVPAEATGLRFWRNTGMSGAITLTANTLGYEFDWEQTAYSNSYPLSRITLSDTTATGKNHKMSLYRASSGALVFGAGTVQWSWGLDATHDRSPSTEDSRIQQATVNLFADMGVQPGSLQSGLIAATASTDVTAPIVTITSPANGATVPGGNVTVTGTASDTGGVVASVKVSTDGGTTWNLATGTTNWTYTFSAVSESVTVQVRAIDDSVNLGVMHSITFTAGAQTCPCSIWTPAVTGIQENDASGVELGVKFKSDVAGYITGIRFFKTVGNTGTHTGRLWTTTGVNLGTVTFSGETGTGWQEATFSSPIAIDANTTYLASYHTTSGNYAVGSSFASAGVDNPPLHALKGGEDGPNGVYWYGPGGTYPTDTFGSSNYLVDVVFVNSVGPDITPPTVTQVTPIDGAININPGTNISVTFSEPMDSLTITDATFELRDGSNALVPAAVSYNAPTRTATLTPSAALNLSSTYTARVIGGTSGVADVAGNDLAADFIWSFSTQGPPPNEGPGGPILVLSTAANPFSRYYAEILRAEGLNAFTATDVSNLTAALLDNYQVVILGEMSLSPMQVTILADWVNDDGGNLIAMRPDSQLLTLLGLTSAGSTLSEAYVLVNTAAAPGQGIVNQTIQFHGTADRYTLNGATSVATLYSNSTTATSNPAVTMRSVGSNGGQAAAFAYDLAKSIVYTRQGNPAWVDINGDGSSGPVRADDLFHNGTDPDWVNLNKVAIPQADEQQRLLANMILSMNADNNPLPRFWYFPRFEKAVVLMTADDHASGNVAGRFDQYKALSQVGCSVDDWECIRSSIYIYPGSTLTATQAGNYTADGFEIGVHVDTGCSNSSLSVLQMQYTAQLSAFASRFPALPQQDSERTHCIAWSGWASQAKVKEEKDIRLDTNYYFWPSAWVNNSPGFMTGSGMPMRFADLDGTMFDVYQAATQMTDESGQSYPATIDTLINNALGSQGYYGVFTANMHSDNLSSAGSDAIIASAQANGVPVVSGRQLLTWLDGRNFSAFSGINWAGSTLNFHVSVGGGANGLTAILPMQSNAGVLQSITRNASPMTFTTETIKGVQYAVFEANPGGDFAAVYAADITNPIISAVTTTNNPDGSVTITWTTDEPSDSRVDYGTASGILGLNQSHTALVTSHSVTITSLTPGATYYYEVKSKDASNNNASSTEDSFVASGDACPCSIWENTGTPASAPVNDSSPIELGTKFRSTSAGYITSIRFYKGAGDTDSHVGHLWTSGGTQLAEVTFTNETASGWQEMELTTPVAINANTTYIVSIFSSPIGYFAITPSGLSSAVENSPLKALASGEDGPNGVYAYGGGFPSNGNNANYWVDVVFDYNIVVDTTPPTIADRSPAVNATGVARYTDVTVTFSEEMNPATITDTTFTLRASGAGSDVPATVSYSGGIATLNPLADLLGNTLYQVTVSGTVTDEAGNPLGSNAVWSFTTNNQSAAKDSSAPHFSSGILNACFLDDSIGDGAVRLNAGLNEDFSGSTLPAGWASHTWTTPDVTVSGGSLAVNGSEAYTTTQYGPGRTLEFSATFGAQPFHHIGFGGANPPYNESPWVMFSTGNDAVQLYARVLPPGSSAYNTGNDKIPLGNYLGSAHTYRIEWQANSIEFYVDDVLKTTVTAAISATMNVSVSDYQSGTPGLSVDWLRMSPPYASPCTFESRVFDAGEVADWLELTATQTTPSNTSIGFETRTGNTAAPDGTWSSWQVVNSPIASPNGRYAQYRATLGATDTNVTPILEQVAMSYVVNSAPVLDAIGNKNINELVELAFTATASDDSLPNNTLTFSLSGQPSGASITTGGAFAWTPTEIQGPGSYPFDICVSDGVLNDCESITVTVNDVNVAPALGVIGNKSVNELVELAFTATAVDTDLPANTLSYSLANNPPAGASITSGGAFTWMPAEVQGPADHTFDVCVSDSTVSDCETITVTVNEANVSPTLGLIGNKSVNELVELAFTATAVDTDLPANTLSYSLANNPPAGASITTGGAFTWTPTEAQGPADYTFDVCVSDGTVSDCETITVTVNEANAAPVIDAIGNKLIIELTELAFTATAVDTDLPANTLTYSLANNPPTGASITTGGAFTWTPTDVQGPNSYTFDVCVSDGGVSDCESITVTVNETNQPPVIEGGAATKNVTMSEDGSPTPFNLTLNAVDTDLPANTLTWSILTPASHGTASASGTGTSKAIGYTPAFNYNGTDSFVVQVSDGLATDTIIVNVTINAVNNPPTDISLGNASINENQAAASLIGSFSTADIDAGDTFTYSLCGGTDDASFQISGNQLLSAVVFDYETKTSYSICIRSTDSSAQSTTKAFTITINDAIDTATFSDVPTSHWAWQFIESIYAAGITGGCGSSPLIYCPDAPITRAQMAVFLLKGINGASYAPPAVGGSTGFMDVPTDHWAAAWIKQLAAQGITGGCGNGNYCPEEPVTREQMAVFLLKAKHGFGYLPPSVGSSTGFTDVATDHWAAAWIAQLAAEGITSGCGNGNYCPANAVTRDQMAVFLQRAFNLPLP
ncbi:MAG: DUF4082 domain-containing protein [Anaerolineales bacterium]|nr:DUF4082 domain-containing protein [Anaerolineales bacterium]